MIIKEITQSGTILDCDDNQIAPQYSENLQLHITYDNTYTGWAIKWDAIGSASKKRIPLDYDIDTACIILNKDCFMSEYIYIACAFIKGGEVVNTEPLELHMPASVNHGLETVPNVPGLFDEMKELFEQIYANEYRQPLQNLINEATDRINAMIQNATTDYTALKKDTDDILEQLKLDYTNYINSLSDQYDKDKSDMLAELAKQIQALKDTTTAAIDTMIKNANTDLSNLKQTTQAQVDALHDKAQAQQTQIDTAKQSMDNLQADLISKRDSGYFNGKDGVTLSGGMLATFGIKGNDLMLMYPDGGEPPNVTIKDGNLIWKVE